MRSFSIALLTIAVVASMLGTQMLAMLPVAQDAKVPLVTISGTAKITALGNPWVFRFFPGDSVVKVAHARYVVEVLGKEHPAIIYQNDAYGQSGLDYLTKTYTTYHGSNEGLESLLALAKDSPFPPEGFSIESVRQIAAQKAASLGSAPRMASSRPTTAPQPNPR